VQTAEEVLAETGGFVEVSEMGVNELMTMPGFGKESRAETLFAALLGRRISRATLKDLPRLDNIEVAGERLVDLPHDEQRGEGEWDLTLVAAGPASHWMFYSEYGVIET
jgi:DNA repair protein RadC